MFTLTLVVSARRAAWCNVTSVLTSTAYSREVDSHSAAQQIS